MANHLNQNFILSQQKKLLELKIELLNNIRSKGNEDLHVATDEIVEDGDQAQTYLNQNLNFGLRERELQRLHEIEDALARIELGIYGVCEETDEIIDKRRLEKMPWTKLSIQAAEEIERETMRFNRSG